jgi:hypothetical protein
VNKYLSVIALGAGLLMSTSELALAQITTTTPIDIDSEYRGQACIILGEVYNYTAQVTIDPSGPYVYKLRIHNEERPKRFGVDLFIRSAAVPHIDVTSNTPEASFFEGSCAEAHVIGFRAVRKPR